MADVSHELRTPLTTVRMAGDVLHEARGNFDPATGRAAELLQLELDRFETLLVDLLEISPNADPPVVKILDYGKFKYEQQTKKNEAKKKQKVIEIKEIKVRPNIDENDYQVKMRAMKSFIEEGDKVKVTLRFRGREMAHQDIGIKVLERIRNGVEQPRELQSLTDQERRILRHIVATARGNGIGASAGSVAGVSASPCGTGAACSFTASS